ncbi:MAG: transposase [Anaerolineales bacterium]
MSRYESHSTAVTVQFWAEEFSVSPDVSYRRNLPHIHPEGHAFFITFSLLHAIPYDVLEWLKKERENELRQADVTQRYSIQKKHFGKYDEWLDRCENSPRWLEEPEIAAIVAHEIERMNGERYALIAYCIMPNHVHLLVERLLAVDAHHHGQSAKYPLTDTLRLLKGRTARACNLALKREGQFWQHESYDHFVRNDNELGRIIAYILNNPVKAGLVKEWSEWKFSYISPEWGKW